MLIDCFWQSLGGWTFVFDDYYDVNITRYLQTSHVDKLAEMVDPYCKTLSKLLDPLNHFYCYSLF
jgi:PhoPQ-activated pathogenicity-related protein